MSLLNIEAEFRTATEDIGPCSDVDILVACTAFNNSIIDLNMAMESGSATEDGKVASVKERFKKMIHRFLAFLKRQLDAIRAFFRKKTKEDSQKKRTEGKAPEKMFPYGEVKEPLSKMIEKLYNHMINVNDGAIKDILANKDSYTSAVNDIPSGSLKAVAQAVFEDATPRKLSDSEHDAMVKLCNDAIATVGRLHIDKVFERDMDRITNAALKNKDLDAELFLNVISMQSTLVVRYSSWVDASMALCRKIANAL